MTASSKTMLLLILDGWGYRKETAWNAIAQAHCPYWRGLLEQYPHTLIDTHGLRVGLPEGQMGNSEVGHMNIGAGRVVYQDLTRIDQSINDGSFRHNSALLSVCSAVVNTGGTLHIFGLCSPGGVHSHENHILEMFRLAVAQGVRKIALHAFLDGRDTPPRSAEFSLQKILEVCHSLSVELQASGQPSQLGIATIIGRYYAMDRDQRWERVQLAYQALVAAQAEFHEVGAINALHAAYDRGESDEFVKPTVVAGYQGMQDGDAVVFMNFRADRARQLTQVLTSHHFDRFERRDVPKLSAFVTLTEYARELQVSSVAYPPQNLSNTLGEYLSWLGKKQLRIAETEKYAHVTFFFNGGRELAFDGEDRVLIPSPKVATYDLQPEMSLPELTEQLAIAIRSERYDLIVCNIANPDMVGHTGILTAAVLAAEAVDRALATIIQALREVHAEMLVTADHGNLEQMLDDQGNPHTQHTTGPVPLLYFGRKAKLRSGGALQDVAPTLLDLMGLAKPSEMTGESLVILS
jgi:2,3-bisphosphoglycerate-independent phosphoglycerate mutase